MRLRRAGPDDLDFLVGVQLDEDVRPFLATAGAYERDGLRARIERGEAEPERGELLVIEVGDERAGAMSWELVNERSAIAHLGGVAVHPAFRGRRLADDAARLLQRRLLLERGLHRLQLEIYGFNERAQRHAERSGFVREGVKRRAYRRGDDWVDGVLYAILREDLEG